MSKCIVGLKITVSSHGEIKAVICPKIKELTTANFSLGSGEIELSIEIDGVREE